MQGHRQISKPASIQNDKFPQRDEYARTSWRNDSLCALRRIPQVGWKRQNPGSAFLSAPSSVRSSPTEEALWRPGKAVASHAPLADHMRLISNQSARIHGAHWERTHQPIQSRGLDPNACGETLGALSQAAVTISKGLWRGAEVQLRSLVRTRPPVRRGVRYDITIACAPWGKKALPVLFKDRHKHRDGSGRLWPYEIFNSAPLKWDRVMEGTTQEQANSFTVGEGGERVRGRGRMRGRDRNCRSGEGR